MLFFSIKSKYKSFINIRSISDVMLTPKGFIRRRNTDRIFLPYYFPFKSIPYDNKVENSYPSFYTDLLLHQVLQTNRLTPLELNNMFSQSVIKILSNMNNITRKLRSLMHLKLFNYFQYMYNNLNDKQFKLEYDFKDVDFCYFHDIKFLLNVFRNYNITSEKELPHVYMANDKYPVWVEKRFLEALSPESLKPKQIFEQFQGGTLVIKMKIAGKEKFKVIADDNKTILEGNNDYHLGYYIFQFEVEFDKNQLFPRPAYVSDINSVLGGNLISIPQKPILDRRKLLNS